MISVTNILVVIPLSYLDFQPSEVKVPVTTTEWYIVLQYVGCREIFLVFFKTSRGKGSLNLYTEVSCIARGHSLIPDRDV